MTTTMIPVKKVSTTMSIKSAMRTTARGIAACSSALCLAGLAYVIPAAAHGPAAHGPAAQPHWAPGTITPAEPSDDDSTSEGSSEKPTGAPQGENLDQKVEENENFDPDTRVVLDAHHVDLGPRLIDHQLALQVRDDTKFPPTWRPLDKVVLKVSDAALMDVPDSSEYDFLSFAAGKKAWVIPQVEVPGVVWLGWSTQHPSITENATLGVTFNYQGIEGPGDMALFVQPGNFQPPQPLFTSRTAGDQPTWVELNTHTHANWVFSAPGTYLVKLTITADLIDGTKAKTTDYLRFSVGDATDPNEAFDAVFSTHDDDAASAGDSSNASPSEDATASDNGSPSDAPASEAGNGAESTLPIAAIVGIGALAIAVLAAGIALSSKRRQAAASALLEKDKAGKADTHD